VQGREIRVNAGFTTIQAKRYLNLSQNTPAEIALAIGGAISIAAYLIVVRAAVAVRGERALDGPASG
jgi:hypothetical protein